MHNIHNPHNIHNIHNIHTVLYILYYTYHTIHTIPYDTIPYHTIRYQTIPYHTYLHTYLPTYIHTLFVLHYIQLHYLITLIHTYIHYIHTLHYITFNYITYIHTLPACLSACLPAFMYVHASMHTYMHIYIFTEYIIVNALLNLTLGFSECQCYCCSLSLYHSYCSFCDWSTTPVTSLVISFGLSVAPAPSAIGTNIPPQTGPATELPRWKETDRSNKSEIPDTWKFYCGNHC